MKKTKENFPLGNKSKAKSTREGCKGRQSQHCLQAASSKAKWGDVGRGTPKWKL